jgi:hypothetical protein
MSRIGGKRSPLIKRIILENNGGQCPPYISDFASDDDFGE